MSINWVMLAPASTPPYTPLANEQTLFTSPPRIGLSISTPSHFPGKQQQPFSLTHSSGVVYLTNRRIIYLPDRATERLKSLAAPILNLHDSHVTAPFFGPNVWTALLQPVPGGGIPTPGTTGVVELKFTFKEGGAFDFHTRYERVRERLQHALEVSRMDGGGGDANARDNPGMNGVNVAGVDLEELPAYQERSDGPLIPPTGVVPPVSAPRPGQHRDSVTMDGPGSSVSASASSPSQQRPNPADHGSAPPDEPPPGYEEAQMAGLEEEAERRLREQGHDDE